MNRAARRRLERSTVPDVVLGRIPVEWSWEYALAHGTVLDVSPVELWDILSEEDINGIRPVPEEGP